MTSTYKKKTSNRPTFENMSERFVPTAPPERRCRGWSETLLHPDRPWPAQRGFLKVYRPSKVP